ncbi:MAG: GNAT family N-acetyltransferase [Alphaproteobacteria bacterium]|nr:GNAT family N-acetyltransferase [Alphaproteobacteria bacterium]
MTGSATFDLRRASPADASAIAHVYVNSWRSTYKGLIPGQVLAALNELKQTRYWWNALCDTTRGGGAVVAEGASQVVGFSAFGSAREDGYSGRGEIYTLYLLDAYQRCGLGRRLLAASADDMVAAGFSSMCVWVLAGNPARDFYERFGGIELSSRDIGVGGGRLEEICYLWPDLRRLEALEEH